MSARLTAKHPGKLELQGCKNTGNSELLRGMRNPSTPKLLGATQTFSLASQAASGPGGNGAGTTMGRLAQAYMPMHTHFDAAY